MSEETTQAPWTVGLTGGIAAGKSAVSSAFAARGVPVYDADVGAREVAAPGTPGLTAIVEVFGQDVLDADGQLDRRALRHRVFADAAARRRLEAILHPRIDAWLREHVRGTDAPYCVTVIPLLAETWPQYEWVDRVLVVTAPSETRIARLVERDGIDHAAAQRILDAQASDAARRDLADDIIDNGHDLAALDTVVERLHRQYLDLAASRR